jgi:hypothetical protein
VKAVLVVLLSACGTRGATPPAPITNVAAAPHFTYDETCARSCIGYSPATDTWLCQHRQTSSGMVTSPGSTCTLELLRADHVLAEAVVLAETYGAPAVQQTIPFELALRLAPLDLAPTKTIELMEGADVAIPGSRHRLHWEPRTGPKGRASRIEVVCHSPLASRRPEPVYTAATVCDLRERYTVEIADATHLAVVVDGTWGCVDYAISERQAHPIDLAQVCGSASR